MTKSSKVKYLPKKVKDILRVKMAANKNNFRVVSKKLKQEILARELEMATRYLDTFNTQEVAEEFICSEVGPNYIRAVSGCEIYDENAF